MRKPTVNTIKDKIMLKRGFILLSTLLVSLSGCAKDRTLSPPLDSEQVIVRVKVPKQLEAETMQVMYRSTVCTFTDHSAYGTPYKRDGYQRMDIQPARQGVSDIYEAKLSVDGGGNCQWRLSNVTFGVVYKDPISFGEGVTFGSGGGVVVVFDQNNSSRGRVGISVEGDVKIKKDYYPWVDEEFIGSDKKTISLAGETENYLTYQALQARYVYFEPVLHSNFILYSSGPKVKKEGNYTSYTYPDGSVVADGRWHPNFRKLQAIRLNAEAKQ
jgi:hypothetical protein